MHRRMIALLMVLMLVAVPLAAQESEYEVFVDGLVNPRNIAFDAEGNLYVAEAGNAGPLLTPDDVAYGASSQITMVTPDGETEVVMRGLISYREGNALGASGLYVTDESIWAVLSETADFAIPWSHALVEFDKETGRVKTFVDLLELELTEDPDGNPNEQSNPVDMDVLPDGTVIIANAGCNCLMTWNPEDGLAVAAVWPFEDDNPVPTAVEVDGEGSIYVGFLTGFPFPAEGSRIEKWTNGELVETYEGLTAISGMHVTEDGTIYAAEFGVFENGWQPGRVVMVSADGITPIAEGLAFPFGIEEGPDGMLYVAVGSQGGQGGQIIKIDPGMGM